MKFKQVSSLVFGLVVSGIVAAAAGPLDNWHWRYPQPQANRLGSVAYGNGVFVAVGDRGTVMTSPSGSNWVAWPTLATNSLTSVVYGGGQFVAVSAGGRAFTSSDGTNWSNWATPVSTNLNAVGFDGSRFVAVGAGGTVLTSYDAQIGSRDMRE